MTHEIPLDLRSRNPTKGSGSGSAGPEIVSFASMTYLKEEKLQIKSENNDFLKMANYLFNWWQLHWQLHWSVVCVVLLRPRVPHQVNQVSQSNGKMKTEKKERKKELSREKKRAFLWAEMAPPSSVNLVRKTEESAGTNCIITLIKNTCSVFAACQFENLLSEDYF